MCVLPPCVYSCGCGAQQRPEEPQKPWKRGGSCVGTAVWVVGTNPGPYNCCSSPQGCLVLHYFKSICKTIICNSVTHLRTFLSRNSAEIRPLDTNVFIHNYVKTIIVVEVVLKYSFSETCVLTWCSDHLYVSTVTGLWCGCILCISQSLLTRNKWKTTK